MRFSVTQEHINIGRVLRKSKITVLGHGESTCPVALAIKDKLQQEGYKDLWNRVFVWDPFSTFEPIQIGDKNFRPTDRVLKEIHNFDAKLPINPFVFHLDL